MYVIAEFRDQGCLENAIQALKTEDFDTSQLAVFSEEPVEFRRGILDRPSRMSLFAVLGAVGLGGAATTGVYLAQHNYPLVTGGMPLFSFWGTGVISYETTMLGAVLATFACFLWESGLVRKRDKTAPVPVVPPGSMCLRVYCGSAHALDRAGRIVELMGAIANETIAASGAVLAGSRGTD